MKANNVKAMREALEKADAALSLISKSAWFIDANFAVTKAVIEAGNAIEAALSAPPRNCDVGTAEEQEMRLEEFCDSHECNIDCPLSNYNCSQLSWAQMPYEEGEHK